MKVREPFFSKELTLTPSFLITNSIINWWLFVLDAYMSHHASLTLKTVLLLPYMQGCNSLMWWGTVWGKHESRQLFCAGIHEDESPQKVWFTADKKPCKPRCTLKLLKEEWASLLEILKFQKHILLWSMLFNLFSVWGTYQILPLKVTDSIVSPQSSGCWPFWITDSF